MTMFTHDPQTIEITENAGRFTATWTEWNQQPCACCCRGHLTRADALDCAEQRIRYRA